MADDAKKGKPEKGAKGDKPDAKGKEEKGGKGEQADAPKTTPTAPEPGDNDAFPSEVVEVVSRVHEYPTNRVVDALLALGGWFLADAIG